MIINYRKLNINGPFSMGTWVKDGAIIGNEEQLTGRSIAMADTLRQFIISNYSPEKLKQMSLIDVGAHDGWLCHSVSNLGLKKIVALEPRSKSVNKGKLIRSELGIDDKVEFRIGTLDQITDEKFDIVVCTGVLYHVVSIPVFLEKLVSISDSSIFLESRIFKYNKIPNKIRKQITTDNSDADLLKDIHLNVVKGETSFGDGSSHMDTIVTIPTEQSIKFNLQLLGLENIVTNLNPVEFKKRIKNKNYPSNFVIVSGFKAKVREELSINSTKADIINNERKYLSEVLPKKLILRLEFLEKHLSRIFNYRVWEILVRFIITPMYRLNFSQSKICFDLHYSLKNKLDFEAAKNKFFDDDISSQAVFEQLLSVPNQDWRVVYRSLFYLLVLSIRSESIVGKKSKLLILEIENSNPEFPIEELLSDFIQR
jgi:2-polyprenyl-3-methyl-5-hydroxy-6-metoxy-1,4-benzoquinol methylase